MARSEKELIDALQSSVERGRTKEAERLLAEALEAGVAPVTLVREGLSPGMQNVGVAFSEDRVDIPQLLCAARTMQKGIEYLQPYLNSGELPSLGTAIIGTVEGDLHEIGKNMVCTMFKSVGFEVVDLGVDVTEKQFVRAVQEHPEAKIVCVSCLLTTTMDEVRNVVHRLKGMQQARDLKIMVGGGSVTESFAKEIGADAYTENAADAAEMAKAFIRQMEEM